MVRLAFFILFSLAISLQRAEAQESYYIQIEAHPSTEMTNARARDFDTALDQVNAFELNGGWSAVALGPFSRTEAQSLLRVLRSQGRIPGDSYIAEPGDYGARIYPQGGAAIVAAPLPPAGTAETAAPAPATEPAPQPQPVSEPEPQVIDETPREAQQSEALLSAEERMALQVALKWAGHYDSAIDGAFGRGTRTSMAAWQEANGFEPTGILTTLQRAELLRQYNAVFDGMGLTRVAEARAGIEMEVPLGVVAFDRYDAPFVHFEPTGDLPARVLLISQPGDQDTLFGLYEIMQTLEIVPLQGPRERGAQGFTLEGRNTRIVSYTQAQLRDGAIKGFTLIWPAGDEARRSRILERMKASFATTGAVLDPATGAESQQRVDLVAGLQVRKPILSRSGFYVDAAGAVLTAAEAVQGCGRITLGGTVEADVTASDARFALLRPRSAQAPMEVAGLISYSPRLQSELAVAGYSYEGALVGPTLTYGTLADLRGLDGDTAVDRLEIEALPGDVGGPVLDASGGVLGLLLPRDQGARQLPAGVGFAASAETLRAFLTGAGVAPADAAGGGPLAPEDLEARAAAMTVLVGCWE
ncbi:MAG: peptidoglycan-binding protein [Roseivivax sp.]|nr:peptidoglycan-binding protein [Roseivivax sp.]